VLVLRYLLSSAALYVQCYDRRILTYFTIGINVRESDNWQNCSDECEKPLVVVVIVVVAMVKPVVVVDVNLAGGSIMVALSQRSSS